MRKIAILATLACCACGGGDATVSFDTRVEWPLIDPCNARDSLMEMQAVLDIGGHSSCALHVNSDLSASGECSGITRGLVRPLGLGYWLPDPDAALVALAYVIGWVDLRTETLGANITAVDVSLVADGVTGTQVDRDTELNDLPGPDVDCRALTQAPERNLCEAEAWARQLLEQDSVNFDRDNDSQSNLQEACNGTIFGP